MLKKALIYSGIQTVPLMGCLVVALYEYNCEYYRTFPQTPNVLDFAKYEREDLTKGFEDFLTIDNLLETKVGDCEDLAAAYAAWLTVVAKRVARPTIAEYQLPSGTINLHCFTRDVASGKEYDPSLALGMPPAPVGSRRLRQWLL